jgi:hypothetical protein
MRHLCGLCHKLVPAVHTTSRQVAYAGGCCQVCVYITRANSFTNLPNYVNQTMVC